MKLEMFQTQDGLWINAATIDGAGEVFITPNATDAQTTFQIAKKIIGNSEKPKITCGYVEGVAKILVDYTTTFSYSGKYQSMHAAKNAKKFLNKLSKLF